MFFLAGFKYAACRIATILFLVIPVSFKAGTARTIMTISLTRAAVTMAVISTAGALPAAGLDAQWRFFRDFDRCGVRFFCQKLDGGGDESRAVIIAEQFFGAFLIGPVFPGFDGSDQIADGRLLGSFQRFRQSRSFPALDAAFDEPFDSAQVFDFSGNDKRRSFPALTGPACPAYAVNVTFRVLGQVIIEYMGDAADIETTGGHVGRDEDVDGALSELADDRITLGLCQVTVYALC